MKKLLNFRPLVLFCLMFIAGILIGLACLNYYLPVLIISVILISAFLITLALIKFLKLKNKIFLLIWKLKYLFSLGLAVIFAGFLIFNLAVTIYDGKNIDEKQYAFTGSVFGLYKVDDDNGYQTVILENVNITDGDKTVKLPNKTLITFKLNLDENEEYYVNLDLRAGYKIEGVAAFKNIQLIDNGVNTFGIRNGFRYFAFCDGGYEIASGQAGFIAGIRQYVSDTLEKNLTGEAYSTAYALVLGDKSQIKSETAAAFNLTGMAYVFAVSGLHVGILMALLFFIFKKLRLKYKYQFVISFLILLFYAALCSFSPSVLRAALMSLIYLGSKVFKRPYDGLSSLSFAALIILVFSPLFLFDAGFLMSFFAIIGIILLTPLFQRLFRFLPKYLNSAVSVSLAAQIAILPLVSFYFGYVPLISLVLNILIVPLITIIFIFLLILLIIPIHFVFWVPQILLKFVLILVKLCATLSFVNIPFAFKNGFIIYYFIILIVSVLIFLRPRLKAFICCGLAAVLVAVLVLTNLQNGFSPYSVCYYDFSSDIYSVSDSRNFYLISGGNNAPDYKDVSDMLKSKKINDIEGVVIFQKDDNYMTLINEVLNVSKIDNVYIRESMVADDITYMTALKNLGINVYILQYKEPLVLQNMRLTLYGSLTSKNALYVDLYNFSVLFIGNTDKAAMQYLLNYVFLSPQIIVTNGNEEEFYNYYHPQVLLCKYQPDLSLNDDKIYALKTYGELILSVKNGIITKS